MLGLKSISCDNNYSCENFYKRSYQVTPKYTLFMTIDELFKHIAECGKKISADEKKQERLDKKFYKDEINI